MLLPDTGQESRVTFAPPYNGKVTPKSHGHIACWVVCPSLLVDSRIVPCVYWKHVEKLVHIMSFGLITAES